MNFVTRYVLAGFIATIGCAPVSSFAQDASCSCATAYRGAASQIGSLGSVKGDVMVSQTAGYAAARAGNALDFGSRVVVGPRGSASILVGDCKLTVSANSSLDISRVGNSICLKVVDSEQTSTIKRSVHRFGLSEEIFAGALLTSGVLAATQNNDNAVSH